MYSVIKQLHITCVILSICGFCLRGWLLAEKSALAGRRWFRILPHVNDTLLLMAALTLAAMSGQYPFVDAWLTAKVFGLIAYIILGSLALKPGRPVRIRLAAGIGAAAVFGWIVTVAIAKHPLGLLA